MKLVLDIFCSSLNGEFEIRFKLIHFPKKDFKKGYFCWEIGNSDFMLKITLFKIQSDRYQWDSFVLMTI